MQDYVRWVSNKQIKMKPCFSSKIKNNGWVECLNSTQFCMFKVNPSWNTRNIDVVWLLVSHIFVFIDVCKYACPKFVCIRSGSSGTIMRSLMRPCARTHTHISKLCWLKNDDECYELSDRLTFHVAAAGVLIEQLTCVWIVLQE